RGQGVLLPDAGRRVLRRPVDDVHRRSGRGRAGAATHLLPRPGLLAAERRHRDGGAVAGPGARLMTDTAMPRPRPAGVVALRGAPVAAVLADLAGALTLGGAAVAGWLLREPADRARALLVVAIAAGATTLLRGAGLVLSYAVATGQPVGSPRFGSDLPVFFGTDLGVWLLSGVVLAAATTTIAVLGTSRGIARTVTALASLVAFAAAMTGHAAGDETHEVGTSTMLIHLL